MFKVGDTVRCVRPRIGYFKYGEVCKVTSISPCGQFVRVKNFPSGHDPKDFELMSPEFNISTATDQELADEYVRRVNAKNELFEELKSRGFKFIRKSDRLPLKDPTPLDNTSIEKTIKEVIVLSLD